MVVTGGLLLQGLRLVKALPSGNQTVRELLLFTQSMLLEDALQRFKG
jgi:hypothetical protein